HDGRPVGHTVMFPHDDTSELAIFVHPDYQSAGIGTKLIRAVLGYSQREGINHVWLTVARDNRIAIKLYRSAGFEIRDEDRGELEMERDL
ncbi:MAG: GNAT family N-acetyltransferase, partial [Halovenus sp.]